MKKSQIDSTQVGLGWNERAADGQKRRPGLVRSDFWFLFLKKEQEMKI